MCPPACGPRPAPGIVRVPARAEFALTVPDLHSELLIDRLRRATIGRYDVYAELGSGGMATVFLALDLALDRKVAIKVMSPALLSSPGAIDRFRREARVAAALSHPHIVPIHAIGEEPGLAYYVMKYVEGTSLDAVLRTEGRQDIAFAQAILGYAGGALQYAHARGVVHRDVKPANIMLDREGWCYVTDFGIAKSSDDGVGITKSGVIIGTPHYMCPEQFNGLPITGAADQYALGVVAFELLTGNPPFGGPSIGEVMRGHLFDPTPDVRSLRAGVPDAIADAVARMLAKDPADRFPSVADAVEAFGRVSATAEREARAVLAALAERGASMQPSLSVPTSPVPQRRPTVHAGSAAAATSPMPTPMGTPLVPTREHASLPAARTRATRRLAGLALAGAAIVGALWVGRDAMRFAPTPGPGDPQADTGGLVGAPPPPGATTPAATPAASPPAVAAGDSTARSTPRPAPDRNADRTPRQRPQDVNVGREAVGQVPLEPAFVRIGSRIPLAVLYVNGSAREVIGMKGVQRVAVQAGQVTLSIRAENCQSWDTTFTATAGALHSIGNRGPRC